MYQKFDYQDCQTALELLMRIAQNTMILYLMEENITQTLEMGKLINHTPLRRALIGNNINQVARAFFEIHRYFLCNERNNSRLLEIFLQEARKTIINHGEEIHSKEKLLHDRRFPKENRKRKN